MHSRWFNLMVLLLWLLTMGWLVVAQILPGLLVGQPPSDATILASRQANPTVGWKMRWDDRTIGWAVNTTTPLPAGLTQIDSTVHVDALPLNDILPSWLKQTVPLGQDSARIPLDAVSELIFDPLGRLSRFVSVLRFQPGIDLVKVHGTIDGPQLTLTVHSGSFNYDNTMPAPQAMLTDAISPQTDLPGLRIGQEWTVQVFSPLRSPTSEPLEVLHAKVEGQQPMIWEDRPVQTWLVVYRGDPGNGSADEERGKLWVHPNGMVLRQEAKFLKATVSFHRMPEEQAVRLAEQVQRDQPQDNTLPTRRP